VLDYRMLRLKARNIHYVSKPVYNVGKEVLINAFEGRHRLALVFVEGVMNNVPILDADIRFGGVVLECQCMLHPVLIVPLLNK
jgi:hypothetical protein